MPAELGLWLYCVARVGDTLPDRLPGVDASHPVERIEREGLAALVSRVPLDEFGEEALKRNLNDLGWLERIARGHEAVLERALERATIVPVRLCTIFADERGALEMLEQRRAALTETLDSLAGRSEWSVKLLVDPEALAAAAAAEQGDDAGDAAAPGSGAEYMLRRRRERELRELADRLARGLAEDVHARVRERATDAVLNAPQNRELSGHAGDMILNGAYLVDEGEVGRLRELVAELQDRHAVLGARVELSGPFPPYNFVERPQPAPA